MKDIASKSNYPSGDYNVDSTDVNSIVSELENAATTFGDALSTGDSTQVRKAILRAAAQGVACAGSGTANAIVATPNFSGMPASLLDGLRIQVKVANANTGAATLNFNGTSAKSINTTGGSALVSGMLTANRWYTFIYNITTDVWVLDAIAQATETSAGIAEIATQAETDAGTDDQRIVTPAKLAAMAGFPRAWAALNGSTGAIIASYGVASASRTAAGQYTVTLTTALPSAEGAVLVSGTGSKTANISLAGVVFMGWVASTTTISIVVGDNSTDTNVDASNVNVALFR